VARTFPAGSYVIDLNQPQRRLAKGLLEQHAELQRSFVEREVDKFRRNRRRGEDADKEDYGFYDITAWSLPLSYNLDAYWTEDAGAAGEAVADSTLPAPPAPSRATTAYLFTNDRPGAARLALGLAREGFRLAVATTSIRADGRAYPRGTFVVRAQRNGAGLHERLTALAPALGVTVSAVQSAFPDTADFGIGSDQVIALRAPSILVAAGEGISETSYGWLWHFLARELGTPFTPVSMRALARMNDMQSFNVLIIPDANGSRLLRELGEEGVQKLKSWVRSGGVFIGYGGAGDFAANKDVGLSTIATVAPDSGAKADTTAPGDIPAMVSPTAPARDRPEWIPGAIFRATLDTTHWLTMGYHRDRLPVFIDGDTFWKPSRTGANPASFSDPADSLVLSGFTWPDNTARLLKGTAWATVENQGSGRVVLFLSDPLFRAFWRGPARLLTNAILVGPRR
jgi:hypothetical protein